jgi:hypothetical protein
MPLVIHSFPGMRKDECAAPESAKVFISLCLQNIFDGSLYIYRSLLRGKQQ